MAVLALAAGTAVVATRKGTRRHRRLGQLYLVGMLAVNASALSIYELFGGFGVFHGAALFSLATVLAGWFSARRRTPGWKAKHAYFMSGSYVGLLAALAAEILTRTPWLPFLGAVGVATAVVCAAGLWAMFRYIPRLLGSARQGHTGSHSSSH